MRRLIGILAAIILIGLHFATSVPANAASFSVTVISDTTVTPNTVTASPTSVNAAPGDTIDINYSQTAGSAFAFLNVYNGTGQVANAGTACAVMAPCQLARNSSVTLTVVAEGSVVLDVNGTRMNLLVGNGGGSSSSGTSSAPVLETLTLQVSTGNTTCTGGSPTGYTGAWLQLPAADACSQSGPDANPNARLLGWATDPIFPVSVAQEIVDLKYGPIDDYFYGMRMIFIPAGGWTFVSSSNNLYPIWSS